MDKWIGESALEEPPRLYPTGKRGIEVAEGGCGDSQRGGDWGLERAVPATVTAGGEEGERREESGRGEEGEAGETGGRDQGQGGADDRIRQRLDGEEAGNLTGFYHTTRCIEARRCHLRGSLGDRQVFPVIIVRQPSLDVDGTKDAC